MRLYCLVLGLTIFFAASSQSSWKCGFNEATDILLRSDPQARAKLSRAIAGFEDTLPRSHKNAQSSIYTIPVVFHVMHLGGPENVSDAQILDALDILNRDFSKQNPDTLDIVGPFQGIAADCQIEFKLATLDENGNCTNGITRHYDAAADWIISGSSYKYTWDRTRYLNIYIVRSLPLGIAAYTYLPGTSSALMDAVVTLHSYFGSIGTSDPYTSRSLGHEVGHWFNLQHTWGSTNQPGVACGDDGVGDTPLTKGFTWCDLGNADVCNFGVEENVQNYMDYSFCCRMFTIGQRNRMHNALNSATAGRVNLWSPLNLQSTGVYNATLACPPVADFASSRAFACVGDTVNFNDYSYGANINSWEWTSPEANQSNNQQQGKLLFNQSGNTTVKLKVSSGAGSDSLEKSAVVILAGANSGSVGLVQGFENGGFPDSLWLRTEAQYGFSFRQNTTTAHSGTASLWLNIYYDAPSGPVSLLSPRFLFQSFAPATLNFQYAYARKSSANQDAFRIYASTSCGQNWIQLMEKKGNDLPTTNFSNTPFVATAQDFSLVSLDLSAYANQPLYLRFEFSPDPGGPGNNFYLDDIMVSGLTGLAEGEQHTRLQVFPNPNEGEVHIEGLHNNGVYKIRLVDTSGRVVAEDELIPTQHTWEIPVGVQQGVYLFELIKGSEKLNFPLILMPN